LKLRRLLETHGLARRIFEAIKARLARKGLRRTVLRMKGASVSMNPAANHACG